MDLLVFFHQTRATRVTRALEKGIFYMIKALGIQKLPHRFLFNTVPPPTSSLHSVCLPQTFFWALSMFPSLFLSITIVRTAAARKCPQNYFILKTHHLMYLKSAGALLARKCCPVVCLPAIPPPKAAGLLGCCWAATWLLVQWEPADPEAFPSAEMKLILFWIFIFWHLTCKYVHFLVLFLVKEMMKNEAIVGLKGGKRVHYYIGTPANWAYSVSSWHCWRDASSKQQSWSGKFSLWLHTCDPPYWDSLCNWSVP